MSRAKSADTADDAFGTVCVSGRADCAGPDADLPCYDCFSWTTCPAGHTWCAARNAPSDRETYCYACATRSAWAAVTEE